MAPLVFSANFDLAIALVACALLLLWQTRREPRVFPALAAMSLLVTIGCGIWSMVEFYRDTMSRRAISTACCACRNPATTTSTAAAR